MKLLTDVEAMLFKIKVQLDHATITYQRVIVAPTEFVRPRKLADCLTDEAEILYPDFIQIDIYPFQKGKFQDD